MSEERNVRLVLQYDGTRYQGWQRQRAGDETIQGKLEAVLSSVAGERVNVIGASRTDAGVHAERQVANFHTTCTLSVQEIAASCLRYLPEDISVLAADEVPLRFHARYLVRGKRYVYRVRTASARDVFRRRYEYHLGRPLDLQAVREAAALLQGEHDFASFCLARIGHKSTRRELTRVEVRESGGLVELCFEAPAFLRGMARILAGTLVEVGLGRFRPQEVEVALGRSERRAAGFTAPAKGLCLTEVRYEAASAPGLPAL